MYTTVSVLFSPGTTLSSGPAFCACHVPIFLSPKDYTEHRARSALTAVSAIFLSQDCNGLWAHTLFVSQSFFLLRPLGVPNLHLVPGAISVPLSPRTALSSGPMFLSP